MRARYEACSTIMMPAYLCFYLRLKSLREGRGLTVLVKEAQEAQEARMVKSLLGIEWWDGLEYKEVSM